MRISSLAVAPLGTLLVACCDCPPRDADAQPDAGAPDAGIEPVADAVGVPPTACPAPPSYGTPVLLDPRAGNAGPWRMPVHVFLHGDLDDGADRMRFEIQLRRGHGAFADRELVAGTYPIAGDELSAATCGVCVTLRGEGGGPWYAAAGGEVTLTQVLPRFVGSASNLTLVEALTAPDGTTVPVPDGCTTRIDRITFDAEVEDLGGGVSP
jgi:hypothetical protein